LRADIGKAATAHSFGARHISSGNLDVEPIAAAVGFIIGQRLIGTDRHSRAFRRIGRVNGRDVIPFSAVRII
jgi:hypothetical protein